MLAIRAARMSDGLRLHDRPRSWLPETGSPTRTSQARSPRPAISCPASATRPSRSDPARTTRRKPRAGLFRKWARRTRPPRSARRRLGEPHGPVLRTPAGWVLPDLYDPDGHQMRFYVPGEGARRRRTGPPGCATLPRAWIEQLDSHDLAPNA
jgi:hypothetical protein